MNAVNLLPPKHRPRQATGGKNGSSLVLIGTLAAVVVAVLVYVLSVNSINDSKSKIAEAQAEAQRANAQADALGAYGNFAKVKQERVSTVKRLAQERVDWERVVRELAHVLPSGVWITKADASDTASASAGGDAATPAAATTGAAGTPTIDITGCAFSQPDVARTMVRLRQLEGASDVELDHSTRAEQAASSGSDSSGSSGGEGGCGTRGGQPNVEFEVKVTLDHATSAPYVPGKVPTSLGGGQ
jgi:Tfp pilus assembly protein PilN